jgi:hypothetical protein
VALSFSVIYFYTKPSSNVNQLQLNYSECAFNPETKFDLCFYDAKTDKFLSYGEIQSSNSLRAISYSLNANTNIQYWLNLSTFSLPNSYRICANGIKLENNSTQIGDVDLYEYNSTTNTEFACVSKLFIGSKHAVSYSGALPCMQSEFPLLELYIFPSTFNGTTITDFKNNVNISEKVFSAYGVTAC